MLLTKNIVKFNKLLVKIPKQTKRVWDLAENRWDIKKFENVLKSKKRKNCAPPAPACGLYLKKIIY